jgi:hypothetical protein
MSRFRLTGICLALIFGGVDLTIGNGSLLNTAMAKGHGGHKGGGHKAGHKSAHHAAHHHAASHHHSHHNAKHHAHAHASGHAAHRAHAHAAHHFAHHYNHHHHHHWHNGHRYWVGNGYYGGTYVDGGTVVNGATVTGDGGSAVVGPPALGSDATLAYPTVLGNIGSIAGNALTIVRGRGKVIRVSATPATIITLNDSPAAIGDLRVSDRVKASYDPESNAITLVALRD